MRRYIKYLVFIIFESFLITIIFLLLTKIIDLHRSRVRGTDYITLIRQRDVVFDNLSSTLRNFYEPKPDSISTWDPEWLGYEVKNTINKDSLNERYDYSVEKQKDTFRIITLGDSFTYGHFVNTSENYSEVLEDLLNYKLKCNSIMRFEVINLGVFGYDIEYSSTRLKKRGIKYNPDLVIYLINDWNIENINELIIPYQKKLESEKNIIYDSKNPFYEARLITEKEIKKIFGLDYIVKYNTQKLYQLSNIYSGKFLFLTFPSTSNKYKEILHNLVKQNTNYFYYDRIVNFFNEDSYRLKDNHPNIKGHQVIAENIFGFLQTILPVKCSFK